MRNALNKLIIESYKLRYRGACDAVDNVIGYTEETFSIYYSVDLDEIHKEIQIYLNSIKELWIDANISSDNSKYEEYEKILEAGINNILNRYSTQGSND